MKDEEDAKQPCLLQTDAPFRRTMTSLEGPAITFTTTTHHPRCVIILTCLQAIYSPYTFSVPADTAFYRLYLPVSILNLPTWIADIVRLPSVSTFFRCAVQLPFVCVFCIS